MVRRVWSRSFVAALSLVAGLALSSHAEAQQLLSAPLDLQAFRPAMDSKGYITLNSSQVLGAGDFSFGLVSTWGAKVLDFTNTGITAGGTNARFAVNNLITPSLQGAVGVFQLGHFGIEIGAVIPMSILSGRGYPTDPGASASSADDNEFSISQQGLGDIMIHPKIRLLNAGRDHLGLAVIPTMVLPTGDDKAFLGRGAVHPAADRRPRRRVRLPRALPRRHQRRHAHSQQRVDVRRRRRDLHRASLVHGRHVAEHRVRDSRQERAARWPRPVVRHRAAEVRHRRRGLRLEEQRGQAHRGRHRGQSAARARSDRRHQAVPGPQLVLPGRRRLAPGGQHLRRRGAARLHRLHLRADHRRPRRRRLQGRRRQVPGRARGLRRLRGRGRLPRSRQRQRRHPRRRRQVPQRARDRDGVQDEDGCPDTTTDDRDGDGIPDDVDKCPDDPEDKDGFEDEDGCPDPDNDKDGIPDNDDLCPNDPEDKDGFEDEDGCPDPDNDKDRILDVDDKCPNEPETYNGFEDEDGCPDKGKVIVRKGKLEILDKIYFETDKAEIQPRVVPDPRRRRRDDQGQPADPAHRDPGPRRRARRRRPQPGSDRAARARPSCGRWTSAASSRSG